LILLPVGLTPLDLISSKLEPSILIFSFISSNSIAFLNPALTPSFVSFSNFFFSSDKAF